MIVGVRGRPRAPRDLDPPTAMDSLTTRLLDLLETLGLLPPGGQDPALVRPDEPAWALDDSRAQERA